MLATYVKHRIPTSYVDVTFVRCWIGKRQLDTAMQHLADHFEFNIRWKPFLLNTFLPEQGIPVVDYFKLKFGEAAAARFMSGSSPLSMQARDLVSTILVVTVEEVASQKAIPKFYSCRLAVVSRTRHFAWAGRRAGKVKGGGSKRRQFSGCIGMSTSSISA